MNEKFSDMGKATKDSIRNCSGANIFESIKSSVLNSGMETFTAVYKEKTFLFKMVSIRFNSVESVLILVNDATESIRLRALEDTNDYKNSLYSSFTHEFKTPLNCLFVMLHSLSIEERIPAQIKESFLRPACYNSEILLNLVNAASDYSLLLMKKLKLERKIINLKDFFENSLESLIYQADKKKLQVDLEFAQGLPEDIRTDPRRLQQILFQLYSNAIKFTYKGSIKIKIKSHKTNDQGIQISVKDSGIGIGEKDLIRLEASLNETNNHINFHRTSKNSIGASLGLTVSQKIAKMLGFPLGKGIICKSSLGVGSKFAFIVRKNSKDYLKEISKGFTFSSAVFKENSKTIAVIEEFESPETNKFFEKNSYYNWKKTTSQSSLPEEREITENFYLNKKYGFTHEKIPEIIDKTTDLAVFSIVLCQHEPVLIIDDDEFNILALSTILQIKNVKSLSARNGQIALKLIKNECSKRSECCKGFKIIFMDLNMPVLNGIETSLELKSYYEKKELPVMPIVACTAFESDIEKTLCFRAGMTDYTTKPLDIKKIGRLVDKWVLSK